MHKKIIRRRAWSSCWPFLLILPLLFFSTGLWAAEQVDIRASVFGFEADTLYVGVQHTLDVYIENDYILYGMSLGFKISSYYGATWAWDDVGGLGNQTGCVTTVPTSRLEDGWVFDMTGFSVTEENVDGISPDTIMCGGVAMSRGLPIGPLEKMYSMHFVPQMPYMYDIGMICIDSAFVPPAGPFVFNNVYGQAFFPTTLWPNGGRCYPVGWCRCAPPQWDPDLPTTIVVEPGNTGSVTLSATDPENNTIIFGNLQLIGGAGEAALEDHGDGTCEVFYTAVPEDAGQDITIKIYARDPYFAWNALAPYVIDVVVPDNALGVDCGFWYLNGATNNLIVKDDISVPEEVAARGLTFSLLEGPGEIDGETGTYTWTPEATEIGLFSVIANISDGESASQCLFQVDVVDENCCPGDANFSSDVNVGDAVYLIQYIFQGGKAPIVMNWGDANADCQVNVGDVVYLISYIFRSGAAPQVGCYY